MQIFTFTFSLSSVSKANRAIKELDRARLRTFTFSPLIGIINIYHWLKNLTNRLKNHLTDKDRE